MAFILRGVKLLGIDSVYCPNNRRIQTWLRIEKLLPATFMSENYA